MKYFHLIWAGLWRSRARTVFTLLSIAIAFVLFGLLQGINAWFDGVLAGSHADRLIVVSRVSQLEPLPSAHLQQIELERLESRAAQLALHGRINHAYRRLQEYLKNKHTWGARHASVLGARPVAYFSAEFGLHESMPI